MMVRGEEQLEAWHFHSEAVDAERSQDRNLIVVSKNETPVDQNQTLGRWLGSSVVW